MYSRLAIIATFLPACAVLNGCAAPQPVAPICRPYRAHLIFNPEGSSSPLSWAYQTDWPSTVAFEESGEAIYYRETLLDTQYRQQPRDDVPYRRFTSVRIGRGYR